MLSHTASTKKAVVAALAIAWHWIQHSLAPRLKVALKRTGHFLKVCYVDGMKALVAGQYDKRQAYLIMAATIPVLLSLMMLVVPTALFPTPEHKAFYHFGRTLADDSISMIPVLLGIASTTLGLKIPVS